MVPACTGARLPICIAQSEYLARQLADDSVLLLYRDTRDLTIPLYFQKVSLRLSLSIVRVATGESGFEDTSVA